LAAWVPHCLEQHVSVRRRLLHRRRADRAATTCARLHHDGLAGILSDLLGDDALDRVRARAGRERMTMVIGRDDSSSAAASLPAIRFTAKAAARITATLSIELSQHEGAGNDAD